MVYLIPVLQSYFVETYPEVQTFGQLRSTMAKVRLSKWPEILHVFHLKEIHQANAIGHFFRELSLRKEKTIHTAVFVADGIYSL